MSNNKRRWLKRRLWPTDLRPLEITENNINGDNIFFDWSKLDGQPSYPGWKEGELERLTNWAVAEQPNRPVICEYEPDAMWLWTRWRGTVLSLTIMPVLVSMGLCWTVDAGVHHFSTSPPWPVLSVPPENDSIIQQLVGINHLWEYLLTLSTFIVTFFTSEAYKYWRTVYFTTRAIQGRINDICLLITVAAERGQSSESENTTGYSTAAAPLVERCSRLIKLSHVFFWAATPTVSNGVQDKTTDDGPSVIDAIGPMLLSAEGMEMLVSAGQLTDAEKEALLDSGMPPNQYAYVLLQWVGSYVIEGIRDGLLWNSGGGTEENILRQVTALRAEYFNIGDQSAGRMPVAYVQLVQVIVDSMVYLAPFALYPQIGTLAIPLTGLLTMFYKGLLELSKSFLDPFGNEGFDFQNIRVDVLVSEGNFGTGTRWLKAGAALPNQEAMTGSVNGVNKFSV